MRDFVTPSIYAALLWWLTTGIILILDRLDPSTFKRSMAGGVAMLALAVAGLYKSADDTTASGAYIAFTAALLIWGCLEMSFLLGYITGPRRHACAKTCKGWGHFVHATQAIIYNEFAILAGFLMIAGLTWHVKNQVSLWTYAILWLMRLSAKLNLFFGVPNVGDQYLPPHLQYLGSFFSRRRLNWLYPVSFLAGGYAIAVSFRLCAAADDPFHVAAYTLSSVLLVLGLLEHVFMILPLPTERLWRWAMSERT